MDGDSYPSYTYKLRSTGPTPTGGGSFITQSFGIDKSRIVTYTATSTINRSDDMAGIPGGIYISASWQRLPYLTQGGGQVFSGNTVEKPVWWDQDVIT